MNKEASNLLARLVAEIYKNEQLQQKVRQLETNIAEAIKLLLDNTADYTDGDFESMRFQNDIVKILKRGKESEE